MLVEGEAVARMLYIGGPTALVEFGELRIVIDPTFDPPGEYEVAPGRHLVKLVGPAVSPEDIGNVDVVLLSHDHHMDNLDRSGRAFLSNVPRVLTTVAGAARLGHVATPMPRWSHVDLARPNGRTLRITSVPAQHGPPGTDHLTGEVTGFFLTADDLPATYISGDNASLEVVRTVVERFGAPQVAILFAGAARTALVPGGTLTLTGTEAAQATEILGRPKTIMLHFEGWQHFTEGPEQLRLAFAAAGLADVLNLPSPGKYIVF